MNKAKRNFWLALILLALFIMTVMSLLGHHTAVGMAVHSFAGTLLVFGSLVHVVWHWDWIKANILSSSRDPGKTVRANLRIDRPLLMLFVVCGASGLLGQAVGPIPMTHGFLMNEGWRHLHALSGVLMLLLIVPHVGHHLKWLVCMVRKSFAPAKQMKPVVDSEILN